MEKIIFFGLAIPILAFVLYLGGTAIMKGFEAKRENKSNESLEDQDHEDNLYDNNDKLVYRGRMDNSSPGNDIEISGNDLREACSNLLNGSTISLDQHPSMGCNIKWK